MQNLSCLWKPLKLLKIFPSQIQFLSSSITPRALGLRVNSLETLRPRPVEKRPVYPSSRNHGPVTKGFTSNKIATFQISSHFFHWTMMMGERVLFPPSFAKVANHLVSLTAMIFIFGTLGYVFFVLKHLEKSLIKSKSVENSTASPTHPRIRVSNTGRLVKCQRWLITPPITSTLLFLWVLACGG